MARVRSGCPVFAIPDIKVWPTDEDDLTTRTGWEVFLNWLTKDNATKLCPKGKNTIWFSTEKKVSQKFDFPLSAAIPWGINPESFVFVRFADIQKPNKKYVGFIVDRNHIVPDEETDDWEYLRYRAPI
jgi:hypothetical protein